MNQWAHSLQNDYSDCTCDEYSRPRIREEYVEEGICDYENCAEYHRSGHEWVVAPDLDSATLVPYAREMYDETAYEAMRALRKPFVTVHYYGFYVLLVFAVIHIMAVVVTELHEGGGLVSAMFSGKKVLSEPPADQTKAN